MVYHALRSGQTPYKLNFTTNSADAGEVIIFLPAVEGKTYRIRGVLANDQSGNFLTLGNSPRISFNPAQDDQGNPVIVTIFKAQHRFGLQRPRTLWWVPSIKNRFEHYAVTGMPGNSMTITYLNDAENGNPAVYIYYEVY